MSPLHIGKKTNIQGRLPPLPPTANNNGNASNSISITSNAINISKQDNNTNASSLENSNHTDSCLGMNLCQECHQQLLKTFEHCLKSNLVSTHDNDPNNLNAEAAVVNGIMKGMNFSPVAKEAAQGMMSIMNMDEFEDGKQLTTAPDFNLIHDTSTQTEMTTSRMLLLGMKNSVNQTTTTTTTTAYTTTKTSRTENNKEGENKKGPSATTINDFDDMEMKLINGSHFSGQLYKAVLQHKNQEIRELKKKLYNKSLNEKLEQGNVNKLQKALGKAVGYYSFAQDWKDQEVRRLQQDISTLKTYLSTLMACIVQGELEKQKILIDVQNKIEIVEKKDMLIREERQKFLEMQETLQTTYRDYVQLNQEHEELLKNSTTSKEIKLIQQKLDTMTQQYKAVSEDFIAMTKDFDAKSLKCRQLEFELSEFLRQFSTIGEEKQKLFDELKVVQNTLQTTQTSLQESKDAHKRTVLERNQLELELKDLTNVHEQFKLASQKESEKNTIIINREKEQYAKLTIEHEVIQKELTDARADIDKMKKEHEKFVKDAQSTEIKLNIRISDRDTRLMAMSSTLDETENELERTKEQRDNLMMKANQLRVDLDTEVSQHRASSLDFKLYKQDMEEKLSNLIRDVNVLTSAKESLVSEGRQMMEDIRDLRATLRKKDAEIVELKNVIEEERKNWEIKEDFHVRELEDLKEQVSLLQTQLTRIRNDFGKASENVTRFKAQATVLDNDLKEMTGKFQKTQAALDILRQLHEQLVGKQHNTVEQLEQTSKSLNDTTVSLKQLHYDAKMAKHESDEMIRTQKSRIKELEGVYRSTSDRLYMTEEEMKQLKEANAKVKKEMERTNNLYDDEKRMKERTEGYLNMAYEDIMAERKMRIEIENLMFKRQESIKIASKKEGMLTEAQMERRAQLRRKLKEESESLFSFMETIDIPRNSPALSL